MFKRFVLLIALLLMLPANAGEVENALEKGNNVFLYLYSADCKYCDAFNPIYNQLLKDYNGQYSFFKVDSKSRYGMHLAYDFRAAYLPYVVLLNGRKKKALHLHPLCLMDNKCLNNGMKDFRK